MTNATGRAITPEDVRAVLTAYGITQLQLGDALRVHWTTVAYWLSSRRHPNAAHSAAIAAMIGRER